MKKSLAALGVGVLGLGMLAAGGATSASAATAQKPCATGDDASEIHTGNPATAATYTDCVPQYGAGKVEWHLDGTGDMSSFDAWDADQVSGIYSELAPTAVNTYFDASTAQSQLRPGIGGADISAYADVAITAIDKLPVSSLNSKCQTATQHYDAVYRYSFAPIHVTIQTAEGAGQGVNGKPGSFTVTKAVPQLTFGLNFKEGVLRNDTSRDHFDTTAAQCAVFSGTVAYAASQSEANDAWNAIVNGAIDQDWTAVKALDLGASSLQAGLITPAVVAQSSGHAGTDATITATVKAGSVYQAGVITVTVDGKRLKTEGRLVGGKLTLTLPHTLKAGTHSALLAFPGGPGALPSTVTKSFTVQK